jgi:hypothetical protein
MGKHHINSSSDFDSHSHSNENNIIGDIMEFLTTLRIIFATLLIMIAFVGMQYFKEKRKQ